MRIASRFDVVAAGEQFVVVVDGVGGHGTGPSDGVSLRVVALHEEVFRVMGGLVLGEVVHRVLIVTEDQDLAANGLSMHEVAVSVHFAGPLGTLFRLGLHPRKRGPSATHGGIPVHAV
jgi:hypothetical protein